jgi:hypothetical protein
MFFDGAKPRDLQFHPPQTNFSFWVLGLASSPREEPWNYKNICLGWSGTADPSASLGMTKERVVERERTVVEGQGGCWGGGDAPFPSTTALFIDSTPLCEIKKVTASQDDDFVRVLTKKHPKQVSAYGAAPSIAAQLS